MGEQGADCWTAERDFHFFRLDDGLLCGFLLERTYMHTFLYMRFYEHGVMYFRLYTRSSTREAALLPFVDIHMIDRELAKTSARYYGAKASFGGVDTQRQTSCIVEFQGLALIFGASQSRIPCDFGCETDPLQHPRSTLRKVGNPLFASHLRRIRSIV